MGAIYIYILLLTSTLFYGQHLYPEKFNGCVTNTFCLDCGDVKAEAPEDFTNQLIRNFNQKSLKDISGNIEIQILIDSIGNTCLLSALNKTGVKSEKLRLQESVNGMSPWKPAISKNKPVKSSVSLMLVFENGNLYTKRRNFDSKNETNLRSVGKPDAKGSREGALSGIWEVYTQENSDLPWDMSRAVAADANEAIWIGTDNGVVKIKNDKWEIYTVKNSGIRPEMYDKNKTSGIRYMAVDKKNNKWFIAGWNAYKYDDKNWTVYDSINSPIDWPREIFIDSKNNVWFTSWEGVAKFDGKNWSVLNKKSSGLPSDKVLGGFVDSKDRLWIGTFEGNMMIDGTKSNLFNDGSPLSKAYISKMQEDKQGNLWFSLYKDNSNDAGVYVLKITGEWEKISYKDEKMFSGNAINDFLLDEEDNSLWVSLNGVGVLKYDLQKEKWEMYTNENSAVPSIHVMQLAKDKSGTIWAATFAGIIKFSKK